MSELYYVPCPLTELDLAKLRLAGLYPVGSGTDAGLHRTDGFLIYVGSREYKWGCIAGTKQVTVEEFIQKYREPPAPVHSPLPEYHKAKFDEGKIDPTLILDDMPRAILALAKLGGWANAEKYTRASWLTVPDAEQRYKAAQDRHRLALAMGEELDPQSGMLHEIHEVWNALAKLELKLRRLEKENV